MARLVNHYSTRYVRMAERSKAPDSRVVVSSFEAEGAFWSTYVGVGSNPTSDNCFCLKHGVDYETRNT